MIESPEGPQRDFPALLLQGLAKSFDKPVIEGLDLEVRAGELNALLGPNGAGKTTRRRPAPRRSGCSNGSSCGTSERLAAKAFRGG